MTWLWGLTAASIAGVVLNIRRRRACFAIWLGTNATWAGVDFAHGLPAQGTLMLVYAGLAVWGWCAWKPADAGGAHAHRAAD